MDMVSGIASETRGPLGLILSHYTCDTCVSTVYPLPNLPGKDG